MARRAWLVPLLFFLAALVLYGGALDEPRPPVFDEEHYIPAADAFARGVYLDPSIRDPTPFNDEHPPLAKYLVGLSVRFLGHDAVGYRMPSVFFGAAGVAGLAVLGRRLFGAPWGDVLPPAALLLDPMWFMHSRLFMLEVFPAAPMVWAFAFALGRQDWEPWAAGAAAALALASKMTALFLFPPLLLVLWWTVHRHHGEALGRSLTTTAVVGLGLPLAFLGMVQLPLLAALADVGGWGYAVRRLAELTVEAFAWGQGGPQTHPEMSPPWEWLYLQRPAAYHFEYVTVIRGHQSVSAMYALGNPVVWWGALLGAILVLPRAAMRAASALGGAPLRSLPRRLLAAWDDAAPTLRRRVRLVGVPCFLFVAGYAPFFLLSRTTFLYYMTLLVPFLALLAGGVATWLLTRGPAEGSLAGTRARIVVAVWGLAAVGLFVWWWPIFTGDPVALEGLRDRLFWRDDLPRPT